MDILNKYLLNNKKVKVEVVSSGEKYLTSFYNGEKNTLCIFRPKKNGHFIYLNRGDKLKIYIYTKVGVFIFETQIEKCGNKLIYIEKTKTYQTIQRRKLLRADLTINFKLKYKINNQEFEQNLKTINISGSGLSFNTNEDLQNVEFVDINLNFNNRIINTRAEIVEIRKNLKKNQLQYRVGVRFISLNNLEAEYIIKQCIMYEKNM